MSQVLNINTHTSRESDYSD